MNIGTVVDGKYRIDALLGEGGMGAVYRAVHLGTTRTVALKIIRPHLSARPEFLERFRREAEAAGRLRHPNVVDVTDFGVAETSDGRVAYLVMEFLDGCTLADVLADGQRLPVTWFVDIVEQVASALDEAHAQGLIHRDLKPDNIWLEPNRRGGYTVKVLDFGLVKLGDLADPAATRSSGPVSRSDVDRSSEPTVWMPSDISGARTMATDALTGAGSVTGTPLYMSPEQCSGGPIDARSDIYSLGVIAYRILAGHTLFTGDAATIMRQHLEASPAPLTARVRRVPRRVSELVMSALAKDPAARPPRAGGFASALRAAAEGSGTLLRQAIALYSERFPTLLRVSAIANLPLLLFLGMLAFVDGRGVALSPLVSLFIVGTMIAVNVGTYLIVPAAVAPLVVQAFVTPLQPPSLRIVSTALRRRWRTLLAATALLAVMIAAWSLLLIVPGVIVAFAHVLYAPVVVLEQTSAAAALRRARRLAKRSWTTVVNITLLQFALPVLVWFAAVDPDFVFRLDEQWQPQEMGFAISGSWTSALYQLLNVFVAPLTGTMTALLYLKSRQAGGESLQWADGLAGVTHHEALPHARIRSRTAVPATRPSTPSPAA